MRRNTVLTVCFLALGTAPLWYAAEAQAIPAEQGELLEGTQPLPDFSAVAHPPANAVSPVISAGPASSTGDAAATDAPPPAVADSGEDSHTASAAIPCMVSLTRLIFPDSSL